MANFSYLIGDASTREVVLVDPAWQIDTVFKAIEAEGLKLKGALVTHSHYDHCNGVEELLARANVPVYVNREEADFVKSLGADSPLLHQLFGTFPEEHLKKVSNGDRLSVGAVDIAFLHTPGHTPGSQCFMVGGNLVSGDTLFIRGCGRCDLPGGNPKQLYESLTQRLSKVPGDTVLLPGHNYADAPTSTMSDEQKKNPYLICESFKTFLTMTGAQEDPYGV